MAILTSNIQIGFCHPDAPILDATEPKAIETYDVKQRNTLRKDTIFHRCPAVQTYMYNTFRVNYPISATLDVVDQTLVCSDPKLLAVSSINSNPLISWAGNILELFCTNVFFFSDTPGVKMLIHPHKDSPLSPIIPAIVDVYKFPRTTHSSAFLSEGQRIEIKRGDPAYLVTFFTPNEERVKLVPCARPEILEHVKIHEDYNRLTTVMKWKDLFKNALRFKPRNQIEKFKLDNR
tara:strand:- start:101 stop:802 length:702 start_codon:yes stop_codon:yes gene_type:complete